MSNYRKSIFILGILILSTMTLPLTPFSLSMKSPDVEPISSSPDNSIKDTSNDEVSAGQVVTNSTDLQEIDLSLSEYPTWEDIASEFSIWDYPSDAEIILNENNLQTMVKITGDRFQIENSLQMNGIEVIRYQSSSNIFVVNIPISDSVNPSVFGSNAIEFISSITGVQYLEPDFVTRIDAIPNDPYWNNQWGPARIGLPAAWDTQLGSSSVSVAVLDTGIDYNHPDLSANYNSIGYDFVNNDNDPMDDHKHGTHVAGTIAAGINDGIGVAGVADVSIFAQKILSDTGSGSYSWAIDAIKDATDKGADILSNSWGGSVYSLALQEAVNYAVNNSALFIAAAGNDGSIEPHYPAALDNVISVSSTASDDSLSSFSNFGPTIDIAAPGTSILSTTPGNNYEYLSGTSMATPHVSGLAALIWSQFPSYGALDVENTLYSSAEDLGDTGYDIQFGYGLIDATNAMNGLKNYDIRVHLSQTNYNEATGEKTISMEIENAGLSTISSVAFDLFQDESIVFSDTIPSLASGTSSTYTHKVQHTSTSIINMTLYAYPVSSESYLANNKDMVELKNAQITNIANNDVVSGGLVEINLDIPDPNYVIFAEMYLNSNWISSISGVSSSEITYFPVFSNTTNVIQYRIYWAESTFSIISLTIQSEHVTSLYNFEVGDFIDWRWEGTNGAYQDFFWDVVEWTSPTAVNMSLYTNYFDGTTLQYEWNDLWAEIDVTNGYYLNANFDDFNGKHFSWLTGLNSLYSNLENGDHFLGFEEWNDYQTVAGLSSTPENYELLTSQTRISTAMNTLTYTGVPTSYENGILLNTSLYPPNSPSFDVSVDYPAYVLGYDNITAITVKNTGSLVLDSLSYDIRLNGSIIDNFVIRHNGQLVPSLANFDLYTNHEIVIEFSINLPEYLIYEISIIISETQVTNDAVFHKYVSPQDPQAPTLISTSEPDPYIVDSTNNVLLWQYSDNNPLNYSIYQNGSLVASGLWNNDNSISLNIDGLTLGIYEFEIFVADETGRTVSNSVIVEVIDPIPVLVEVNYPTSIIVGTTGETISWVFTGNNLVSYEVYRNDVKIDNGNYVANSTVSVSLDGLDVGTYEFKMVVIDANGNTATDLVTIQVLAKSSSSVFPDPNSSDTNPSKSNPNINLLPINFIWVILTIFASGILIRRRQISK